MKPWCVVEKLQAYCASAALLRAKLTELANDDSLWVAMEEYESLERELGEKSTLIQSRLTRIY